MSTSNFVTEICELVVRVASTVDREGELECLVELRLAGDDIELGDEACEVSISKLTIALDLEGVSAVPGTRYGEPRKVPVELERIVVQTNNASKTFKLAGGAKLDVTGPTLGVSTTGDLQVGVEKVTTLKSHDTLIHRHVTALPNLRWEVREHDDGVLRGTYLEGDCLVRLTRAERVNRSAVVARATVKQRDVKISQVMQSAVSLPFFRRQNHTQRKLMELFIKKTLDAAIRGAGKFSGEIILSAAEVDVASEE